jgi:hypothetical protein
MRFSSGLVAVALFALVGKTYAGIIPFGSSTAADIFTSNPAGAWKYYEKAGGGNSDINFVPNQTAAAAGATFQSYIHPDPALSAIIGGDGFNGNGVNSLQFFQTFIQSTVNQSITFTIIGDDGHSLFINDVFQNGGGFGSIIDVTLNMQAGQIYKLELAGNNGPSVWQFGIGQVNPNRNPAVHPLLGGTVESVPNLRINAEGAFAPLDAPEPGSMALGVICFLCGAGAWWRQRRS